uniref:Major vault protein n=1 Tax=Terrapene triunguis TaxID=2587831 RepID=A0A674JFP8_9SAUR
MPILAPHISWVLWKFSWSPPTPRPHSLLQGEKSFFLQPGESLKEGIQDIYILSEDEGLLLRALSKLEDSDEVWEAQGWAAGRERGAPAGLGGSRAGLAGAAGAPADRGGRGLRVGSKGHWDPWHPQDGGELHRKPGDRWLIRGPLEYVPPAEVEVLERRRATPLGENEGIYVRDIKTGKVRAVIGHTYMLTEDEELWDKELPPTVEALLSSGRDPVADQIYLRGGLDAAHGAPSPGVWGHLPLPRRVVLGPELVLLGPDEQFTVLSLSGGRPKTPHSRRSLCLLLGPDFCTDIVTIETADHARLQLQLAYNWHFEVPSPPDPPALSRLFSVPDFVGDACKALASRIRGAVASVSFDDFHKNSNRIICSAVFGFDAELQVRSCLRFPQNGLVVSSVDIQSVEPVDQRTRDALQRSVQLAIEITTNSQEAAARYGLPRGRLPP